MSHHATIQEVEAHYERQLKEFNEAFHAQLKAKQDIIDSLESKLADATRRANETGGPSLAVGIKERLPAGWRIERS